MGALHYLTALAVCATLVGCGQRSHSWHATPDVHDAAAQAFAQACTDLGECIPESADPDDSDIVVSRGEPDHLGAEGQHQLVDGVHEIRVSPNSRGPVLQNVLLHEVGHAIGLGHDLSDEPAVMQPGVDAAHPEYAFTAYTCADRRQYAALRGLPAPDC
mgnify:CR=1 FL=1